MEQAITQLIKEYTDLRTQRRWDEALQILQKAGDLEPSNRTVHAKFVELYGIRGQIKDVARECVRYIDASMTRDNYTRARETAVFLISIFNESEKALNKAIEVFERGKFVNEMVKASLVLSEVYARKAKRDLMQQALQKVLDTKPDDYHTRIEVARRFRDGGLEGRSLSAYKEILLDSIRREKKDISDLVIAEIQDLSGNPFLVHFLLGDVYRQIDELDKAAAEYLAILKEEKGNVIALKALGAVLYTQDKFQLAIKAFSKIIAHNPDDAEAMLGIAQSCIGTGNTAGAIEHLIKTSKIYQKQRKHAEAYKIYKKIIALDPRHKSTHREIHKAGQQKVLLPLQAPPVHPIPAGADSSRTPGLISKRQNGKDTGQSNGSRLFKKISAPSKVLSPSPQDEGRENADEAIDIAETPAVIHEGSAAPETPGASVRRDTLEEVPTEELLDCIIENEGLDIVECIYKEQLEEGGKVASEKRSHGAGHNVEEEMPSAETLDCMIEDSIDMSTCIDESYNSTSSRGGLLSAAASPGENPINTLFEELLPDDFFLNMIISETESNERLPAKVQPLLEELKGALEEEAEIINLGILTLEGDIIWNPLQDEMKCFAFINFFLRSMLHIKKPEAVPSQNLNRVMLESEGGVTFICWIKGDFYLHATLYKPDEAESLLDKLAIFQEKLSLLIE